jgi:hypothetical protein
MKKLLMLLTSVFAVFSMALAEESQTPAPNADRGSMQETTPSKVTTKKQKKKKKTTKSTKKKKSSSKKSSKSKKSKHHSSTPAADHSSDMGYPNTGSTMTNPEVPINDSLPQPQQ